MITGRKKAEDAGNGIAPEIGPHDGIEVGWIQRDIWEVQLLGPRGGSGPIGFRNFRLLSGNSVHHNWIFSMRMTTFLMQLKDLAISMNLPSVLLAVPCTPALRDATLHIACPQHARTRQNSDEDPLQAINIGGKGAHWSMTQCSGQQTWQEAEG